MTPLQRHLTLAFKKFLLCLAIALLSQPAYLLLDHAGDLFRFGEESALWEKCLQAYLTFYLLFYCGSQYMRLSFDHHALCSYLLQALLLKYIYQTFFNEHAKALAIQLANTIQQKHQIILHSGVYFLGFAALSTWLLFLKDIRGSVQHTPHTGKGKAQEAVNGGRGSKQMYEA